MVEKKRSVFDSRAVDVDRIWPRGIAKGQGLASRRVDARTGAQRRVAHGIRQKSERWSEFCQWHTDDMCKHASYIESLRQRVRR
jgi:uncharacterized protein YeaO (DUF488 family)